MIAAFLLSLFPSRTSFYISVAAFALGSVSAFYISYKFHEADKTAAINAMHVTEKTGFAIADKHESATLAQLKIEKENADGIITELQYKIVHTPSCHVNPDIVGLLNRSTSPATTTAAASTTTTAAPVAPTGSQPQAVNTNDVESWAADNNLNVCEPNRIVILQWQAFYADLRECYNTKKWLDPTCKRVLDSH